MKKYLSIVCAIAMLASLTGCGSSSSSSSSSDISSTTEEKTEATQEKTETTTEKTTEKATEKSNEDNEKTLNKKYSFCDITFKLPKSCNVTKKYINNGKMFTANFKDSSMIQATFTKNTSGTAFSELSDSDKEVLLKTYAASFISDENWSTTTSLEKYDIKSLTALKQEALYSNSIYSSFYHFIYGENIYTIAFTEIPTVGDTAYSIQEDVLSSISLNAKN